MKKFYFSIICTFLLFFSANSLFAQESIEIDFNQPLTDWVKYKTHDLADIYYKLTDCKTQQEVQQVLFKVVNKSNRAADVEWEFKLFFGDDEVVRTPDDMKIKLALEAGSTKEGDCDFSVKNKLCLFVADSGGGLEVTKINLINLKIVQN